MACMAVGNILALVLPFIVPTGWTQLSRISDDAWVPSGQEITVLAIFFLCVIGTVILWLNMWAYWARSGKPILWLFPLLVGAWGPAVIYFFHVYIGDLARFKTAEEEERAELVQREWSAKDRNIANGE